MVAERTTALMQAIIDRTPSARHYYSDDFSTYHTLVYDPGHHQTAPGKSQTYSVEGVNADLRHYLARLARKSRCFSRCLSALSLTLRLFVFCHNHRQLYKRAHPAYPANLIDFLPLLL